MSEDDVSREKVLPGANDAFLFRHAISKIFDNIADSVSEKEFRQIMTVLKKPNICRKMHKAMIQELQDNMRSELELICEEGALAEALTKVTKLAVETNIPSNESAWRPPGNVQLHLRSLDAVKIEAECEKLTKLVNEMESENERLLKKVAESRSEICVLRDRITRSSHCAIPMLQRLQAKLEQLHNYFELLEDN